MGRKVLPDRGIILRGLQLRTTRNVDVLVGYPAAVVGSEECGGAGNVIRLTDPAESRDGNGKLPGFRVAEEIGSHIGFGETWRE